MKFSIRKKFYLTIIPFVALISLIMAAYFIREESLLLTDEVVKFAEREIEHLGNTASLSLVPGGDVLNLIDALKNLQKVPSIKYAYVLDPKNKIVQNYNFEKGVTESEGRFWMMTLQKRPLITVIQKNLCLFNIRILLIRPV